MLAFRYTRAGASPVEQPKYLVDNDAGLLMESAT
jgi:hypothetical protein